MDYDLANVILSYLVAFSIGTLIGTVMMFFTMRGKD